MKILHLSVTDKIGGAGIAAYRLHHGLQQSGIESHMLVMRKSSADPNVHRIHPYLNRLERLQRRFAENQHHKTLKKNPRQTSTAYWSLNHQPYPIINAINSFNADVVHLHWIGDNFLPIQQLSKINAPLVWTLHDMWAFTGGCHYAGECNHYQQSCGNCPQLVHPQPDDISRQITHQKRQSWVSVSMTIICPSQWLADCVRDSQVLGEKTVEVIPNGIDLQQFKPIDTSVARHTLNLPQDKNLILFGAFGGIEDPRKGFHHLRNALRLLPQDANIELVVFGAEQEQTLDVSLPIHQVGRFYDSPSMALLYSACDVFVAPSTQDNLPNTILESLACGTPCVAFSTGGIPDLIQHQSNGYLATLGDDQDLANGIQSMLKQDVFPVDIYQQIKEHYALPRIAERYHDVYRSLNLTTP